MAILKGVHFYYTYIGNPTLKYEKSAMDGFPMGNREHVVDVLVKAKIFKKMKANYKKGAPVKAFKEAKTFTAKEFEKTFKVAPPSDDAFKNDDDEYTILKFRAHAAYKDGTPNKNPPQVVGKTKTKDEDGQPVGLKIAIGNGSSGCVQFRDNAYTSPKGAKGISLQLVGIQVLKLIPYDDSGLEFDMDDEDEEDEFESTNDNESFDVDEDDDSGSDDSDDSSEDSGDDSWDE